VQPVKVVIPWMPNPSRKAGFDWVCAYYRHRLGNDSVHVQEQKPGKPFNRSRVINAAVAQFPGCKIIISDADCFICDHALKRAVAEVTDEEMLIPHNRFCPTTVQQKTWLLQRDPKSKVRANWFAATRRRMAQAGIWVVTHAFFMDAPMDERFEGWGCEDTEFLRRTATRRFKGPLYHIHHKRPSKSRFKANRKLHERIKKEGQFDAGNHLETN